MHFWSEGLGDRQLVMNLAKAGIKRDGEAMLLSGVVDSPAPWEYEVRVQRDDWAAILKTAVNREACGFIARHAPFVLLLAMFRSLATFVVLLAWYRTIAMFGPRRASVASADNGQNLARVTPASKK